jgi:hypothetical protein
VLLEKFSDALTRQLQATRRETPPPYRAWIANASKSSSPALPPELIQVCADPSDAVTLTRELRALRSAAQAEPRAGQLLLVMSADVASGIDGGHVEIRSACEWMLEPLHPIDFSWNSGKEP